MKKITFTFFSLILALTVSSQVILSENFDSFTVGDKIAQVSGTNWTTWSGAVGGGEDGTVSATMASSIPNALNIVSNNDVVLLFNDLATGRYQLEFKILVTTGNIGYFNLLQDFAGSNSEWGTQIYFNAGGEGIIDAGSEGVDTFYYSYDTWIDVNMIVDLDDDFSTIYIDGTERVSWKWSTGTFGSGTLNKLDAANFYGTTTGGASNMYFDDIVFTQVVAPTSPTTLTANVNGSNIDLSWISPTPSPNSYTITRNNYELINGITDTSYTDSNPYPTPYIYNARAHYNGLGYSHSSNDAIAEVLGSVDRQYVLYEIGTGTECVYCPGAAMGAEDMIGNGDTIAIVEYHAYSSGDPYNSAAALERAQNYYQFTGYPTSKADGDLTIVGGNATTSLFPSYHEHYKQRMNKKALYTLSVAITYVSPSNYNADITIVQESNYNTEAKTLHTALTESDIQYSWFNQTELHWVCRNMFPDHNGTSVDFSSQTTQNINVPFTIDGSYVKDNCEFVVFLQADPSQEVMQAIKIDLSTIVSVHESSNETILRLYPNPSNDVVNFNIDVNNNYSILDLTGKVIKAGYTKNSINISELNTGVYFVKVEGNNKVYKLFKN